MVLPIAQIRNSAVLIGGYDRVTVGRMPYWLISAEIEAYNQSIAGKKTVNADDISDEEVI